MGYSCCSHWSLFHDQCRFSISPSSTPISSPTLYPTWSFVFLRAYSSHRYSRSALYYWLYPSWCYRLVPCLHLSLLLYPLTWTISFVQPDLTLHNAPQYTVPLLIDVSIVQSFPGSQSPAIPQPRKPPDSHDLLPEQHYSATSHKDKITKYARPCSANGVAFLPLIMESNGFLPPSSHQFLEDLTRQASFFRHIFFSFYLSLSYPILTSLIILRSSCQLYLMLISRLCT